LARLIVPIDPRGTFLVNETFDNHPAVKTKLQQKGLPIPGPINVLAVIDTGATMCLLPAPLIGQLGLPTISEKRQTVITASGSHLSRSYFGSVRLTEEPLIEAEYARITVFEPNEELPFQAILGMGVLSKWGFSYRPDQRSLTIESP
jgi:hypothetical protein